MKEPVIALGLTAVLAILVVSAVNLGGGGDGGDTFVMPTAAPATPAGTVDPSLGGAELGQALVNQNGCLACHTIDGSDSVAPTWLGLFGHTVTLEDGTTVTADEEYIHQSIVDPNSQVVQGFPPIMPPTFGESLSDEEVDAIVAYIKTLE